MQALICDQPTGYENLRLGDMPVPEAGPGEVLIEVKAAGMNFADSLMAAGKYQVKPEPPFVPGLELAGVVARLGAGVNTGTASSWRPHTGTSARSALMAALSRCHA